MFFLFFWINTTNFAIILLNLIKLSFNFFKKLFTNVILWFFLLTIDFFGFTSNLLIDIMILWLLLTSHNDVLWLSLDFWKLFLNLINFFTHIISRSMMMMMVMMWFVVWFRWLIFLFSWLLCSFFFYFFFGFIKNFFLCMYIYRRNSLTVLLFLQKNCFWWI